jgi:hypothetical protein
VKKKVIVPDKTGLNEKFEELLQICHGSSKSKKVLKSEIMTQYPTLRKTHVDNFVSTCFKKEKGLLDNKVILNS